MPEPSSTKENDFGYEWLPKIDGNYLVNAYGAPGAAPGETVRVVGMEGLKLRVERRT